MLKSDEADRCFLSAEECRVRTHITEWRENPLSSIPLSYGPKPLSRNMLRRWRMIRDTKFDTESHRFYPHFCPLSSASHGILLRSSRLL